MIALLTEAEGSLCSEINNNSLAILLSQGSGRVLLADDAEVREEEYIARDLLPAV